MQGKFIHYVKGFICIRISSNRVEQFLNICSKNDITIWNMKTDQKYYDMNITIKDFKKLKPIVRKTKLKIRILERYGFPFFLNRFHKRKLFISGFFLCLLLVYALSNFIWSINITGNISNSNEILLKYLDTLNVDVGMKISDVNCPQIVSKLRENYDNIIWASASIDGSNLIIQIKENEADQILSNPPSENLPYDIISDSNYKISKITVRKGVPLIKTGDTVKTGDILISGKIPIYNDAKEIISYQDCTADADITGIKQIYYDNEISIKYENKQYYDIVKREYFFKIGKYRFSFGNIKNNYEKYKFKHQQYNYMSGLFGLRTITPYQTHKSTYTEKELKEILNSEFHYYCTNLKKKGVVILQNDVKIYTWSDRASAYGYLTIEKKVGHKELSKQEELGDTINGNDGNNN